MAASGAPAATRLRAGGQGAARCGLGHARSLPPGRREGEHGGRGVTGAERAAAISGRPCVLGKPRPGVGGSPPPQGVYIRPAVPDVRLGRHAVRDPRPPCTL